MKPIRRANLVLVADSDHALLLAERLRRFRVAGVTTVTGLDEAQRLCNAGDADVCLVAHEEAVIDARPRPEAEAPGRHAGVPSLMIVQAVTPYLRKEARRAGYAATVPAGIAPRLLYRRIGAVLQRRRAARRRHLRPAAGIAAFARTAADLAGKPTLH